MEIQSLKLAYFSPTGTTRSIVQAIARGIDQHTIEQVDVTPPNARKTPMQVSGNELLIIGVPVYIGRVPALLGEWLDSIRADKSPAVCVVVYGNRNYEDALLELRDIMASNGCMPIACAAFIGEHAFSSSETPIGASRPDTNDITHAEMFGRKIRDILKSVSSFDRMKVINVPGNYPYKALEDLLSVDFISIGDKCVQCGVCSEVCPVSAVDSGNSSLRDKHKCILCCACIKRCPENARAMKDGTIKDIAIRVSELCKERREPAFFF